MLSNLLSELNYGGEEDYLPTQYLCEYIRELGFDGIRFASSLNQNGKIIVLFDANDNNHNNYEIMSTKVCGINLNYSRGFCKIA